MTRAEAIFELIKYRRRLEEDPTIIFARGSFDAEPFDMAIEALEEAKKREKTWDWCTDCKEYDQENHCCHRLNNVIYDTLCGTIVVVGEWIPHEIQVPWGDSTTDVTMFRCSMCGYEQDWQSKFCPNCGADMRGESDDKG